MNRVLNPRLLNIVKYNSRLSFSSFQDPLGSSVRHNQSRNTPTTFNKISETGLFDVKELSQPEGFQTLQDRAIRECNDLLEEALSPHRKRKLVQILDDMSDTLCRVADLADCIRLLHPDEEFRLAAESACANINEKVELLNTNHELFQALRSVDVVSEESRGVPAEDEVDKRVRHLLLADFELSGINLDEDSRRQFVQENSKAFQYGSIFVQNAQYPSAIHKSSIPNSLVNQFLMHCYPSTSPESFLINSPLCDNINPMVREIGYRAFYAFNQSQEDTLQDLILARHKLARCSGFNSFAHRATQTMMTGDIQVVNKFLLTLAERVKPLADKDCQELKGVLSSLKNQGSRLNLWDLSYLMGVKREECIGDSRASFEYFSLSGCMMGVRNVCQILFDVDIEIEESLPIGEVWHPDVVKLNVRESGGDRSHIGTIYCDLYQRKDKPIQDCHYTIRGGRLLADGSYQSPIVVLQLNFTKSKTVVPCLLSPCQVENLFHEFGHAMHSMLGRTRFQHVTGTRCSTDFAEVPSSLLEEFALDPRVTATYARHYKTGDVISIDLSKQIYKSRQIFEALDVQQQIIYALLDQELHQRPILQGLNTSDLLKNLYGQHFSLSFVNNTAWHHRFTHLVGYGAKYYAYLMSRSLASLLWLELFADKPLCSINGAAYRREILSYGGEKKPVDMVENLIGKTFTAESLTDALVADLQQST